MKWAANSRQNPYDAIVLDWLLPGRDGLSVCRVRVKHADGSRSVDLQAVSDTGLGDEKSWPRRVRLQLVPELRHVDAHVVALVRGARSPGTCRS